MLEFTKNLKPHPENERIYGDRADEDLISSIRDKGILSPLIVTKNNTVLAGHRRLQAAQIIGLEKVPIARFGSEDELDILEAIVHLNKQRVKSKDILAREARALMEVERERAKRRKRELVGRPSIEDRESRKEIASNVTSNNTPEDNEETGNSCDKVGKKLGVSGKTVERLEKVATAMDELEEQGKHEEAEELRDTLNSRGAKPAYNMARDKGIISDKEGIKTETTKRSSKDQELTNVTNALRWACKRKKITKEDLADQFGYKSDRWRRILSTLSKGTGFLVKDLGDGGYKVFKAVHFVLTEQEDPNSANLKSMMRELHEMAIEALKKDSGNVTASWPQSERHQFLNKIISITGGLAGIKG